MTRSIKHDQITVASRLYWLLDVIFHIIIAITSGFMFYIFLKYNSNYALTRFLHVFLSTLAYVPLMTEALLLFSESNVWVLWLERPKKAWIHAALLGANIIITTIGISIKINSKTERGDVHFYSNHAILGLVSWILCFVSVATGFLAQYSPTLRKLLKPVLIKFIHTTLGLVAFITGMASLILGLDLPAFNNFTTQNEKIVITVLLSLITILCGANVIKSTVNQLRATFS